MRDRRARNYHAQVEAYQKRLAEREAAIEAKLDRAPEMEFRDEFVWQSWQGANSDLTGIGIMLYAERWARLMQLEMAAGKSLEDVAKLASQEADIDGISGAAYWAAVKVLADCWKYGEELRLWHNQSEGSSSAASKPSLSVRVANPAFVRLR